MDAVEVVELPSPVVEHAAVEAQVQAPVVAFPVDHPRALAQLVKAATKQQVGDAIVQVFKVVLEKLACRRCQHRVIEIHIQPFQVGSTADG